MTAERWQQVKAIFNAACELAPAERAALLAANCADDEELYRQVELLLAADEQEGDFMNRPLLAVPTADANLELEEGQPEFETGRMISHYRVERQLGVGGMGVVYLARDTKLGRPVALKLLLSRLTSDTNRVRRFQQEARAASALNHPNILTIYEVGQTPEQAGGAYFIATEFIDGQTLRARMASGGMRLGAALDLLIGTADALAAAHEAGIVHRDIKPENIMLRRDGIVKVLDFGLAKLAENAAQPPGASFARVTTQPGVVMGTVNYMSPEQARGLEVESQSDLFSLGVVMYELLTGRAPFVGATSADVVAALIGGEPRPLSRYAPELPGALQEIVGRALAKAVEHRYQTAREMGDEIKRLKDELEFDARLQGRASGFSDGAAILSMTVGAATNAVSGTTFTTRNLAERSTARFAALRDIRRRHGKRLATVLVALGLAIAGAVFGRQWFLSPGEAIDSIAVLPFANASDDPQMQYLPDGLTESLIGSLSKLPRLKVTASNTVFIYKGRQVDPRQVGKSLQVRAVLIGRVQRQGERLVINAELVDAADGSRLWGEKYQCPLTDIMVVQEEIAREISVGLRLRLSDDERRRLAKRYTENHAAHQLYSKGRYFYLQSTQESLQKALDLFNEAIALDSRYALAHAGVADVYAELSGQYWPPDQAMRLAKQAALTAVALDEALPEAHYALAMVKWWGDWDWAGAEREFQRALELDSNFSTALAHYALFLAYQERFDEALRAARRAVELDPLSAHSNNKLTYVFLFARQYDRAIEQCRETIDLNPSGAWVSWAHGGLGRTLSYLNRHEEAIAELEEAARLNRHDATLSFLGYAYAAAGRHDQARQILRELKTQATRRRVSPIYIARIYLGLGDREQAIRWLHKSYDEHSDHALSLRVDPIYDSLRSDPRFSEMARGIGLPP
ncbi:MAG TPA: protein kinase [Blastocatellia bacterium]|nr:protein kinase [Blastocatellia bacterium]